MNGIKTESKKKECKDIGNRWVRKCPECSRIISYKYKCSWKKSIQNNKPCKWCTSQKRKGIELKSRLKILCKVCNRFRRETTSMNEWKKESEQTLCKSCAIKKRGSNRKGAKMPISAKIILSKKLSGKNHPQYGKPLSEEHRRKIRVSQLKSLSKKIKISPNYNPNACKFFDSISLKHNTHIQHAENGGEYFIDYLGYWLDGYDTKNNVVYEWYEKHHFCANEELRKKDIIRKDEIKKFLKCRFLGYDCTGLKIIDEYQ